MAISTPSNDHENIIEAAVSFLAAFYLQKHSEVDPMRDDFNFFELMIELYDLEKPPRVRLLLLDTMKEIADMRGFFKHSKTLHSYLAFLRNVVDGDELRKIRDKATDNLRNAAELDKDGIWYKDILEIIRNQVDFLAVAKNPDIVDVILKWLKSFCHMDLIDQPSWLQKIYQDNIKNLGVEKAVINVYQRFRDSEVVRQRVVQKLAALVWANIRPENVSMEKRWIRIAIENSESSCKLIRWQAHNFAAARCFTMPDDSKNIEFVGFLPKMLAGNATYWVRFIVNQTERKSDDEQWMLAYRLHGVAAAFEKYVDDAVFLDRYIVATNHWNVEPAKEVELMFTD